MSEGAVVKCTTFYYGKYNGIYSACLYQASPRGEGERPGDEANMLSACIFKVIPMF